MNIDFSDEDNSFKKEVKSFIDSSLDKNLQSRLYNGEKATKEEK